MAYGASRVDGVWGGSRRRPTQPRRGGGVAVPISRCRTRHAIAAMRAKGRSLIKEPRQGRGAGARVDVRKKKARTPRCGQVQLRPRLEEAERVVHHDIRGSHAHERRDGGDLRRREHRRRGSSGAEPGGVIGRNAHGARLIQSCPGPIPHDCFALLRARLPSHPTVLRRWRAACVECVPTNFGAARARSMSCLCEMESFACAVDLPFGCVLLPL